MRIFTSARGEPNPQNPNRSFAWILGGAMLASVCCVGPLVAILVAGGAAAGAVGLVRFKLEFIAAGLIMTLMGIGFSLRKSKRCCSVAKNRRNRILIPAVSLLTFAILVVGSNVLLLDDRVISLASSRLEREPKTVTTSGQLAAPSARQLDVEVTSGVYCPACLLGIQKKVGDAAGVQSVTMEQGPDGNYVARILYDPARIDQAALLTTIAKAPGAINGPYGTKVLRDAPLD